MGDIAKPILTMHCFNNLVEFVNLHKFETEAFAVQWRTLLLLKCYAQWGRNPGSACAGQEYLQVVDFCTLCTLLSKLNISKLFFRQTDISN